jgi:hypothetical protein
LTGLKARSFVRSTSFPTSYTATGSLPADFTQDPEILLNPKHRSPGGSRQSIHRTDTIKGYAEKLGIVLWFIPAGYTDELPPLDRAVIGALKAIFRRRFEELCRESPNGRVTNTLALRLLNEIWAGLSPAAIHAGWAIHEDDFGPEDGDAPDDVEYGKWEE